MCTSRKIVPCRLRRFDADRRDDDALGEQALPQAGYFAIGKRWPSGSGSTKVSE